MDFSEHDWTDRCRYRRLRVASSNFAPNRSSLFGWYKSGSFRTLVYFFHPGNNAIFIGSLVFVVLGAVQISATGIIYLFSTRYKEQVCPLHATSTSGP